MRAAGESLLPKWPNEERQSYESRLKTATLYPAFKRTVSVMTGKPFSKQLTLSDDVPDRIKKLCEDCDMEGHNLHAFSADVMRGALGYGLEGVLIDYTETAGAVSTQADEQAIGARPYLVYIRHNQILGWQTEKVNGITRLIQLRIAEAAEVPDGLYGTKLVKRVRVLTPGYFEIWEESGKGDNEYTLLRGNTMTLQEIPFVPFYGEHYGFMQGRSPLIDLAYQNVKHWQSQSDQDTILHVARVPILAMIGADTDTALTVGASAAVKIPQGGDLKFVEHTGAAIEAGKASLEALEQQMIQTGAELLVQKPGQRSATEANNEAEANKCDLQRIVEGFEDSLDQVLQFMAEWIGEDQGGHVSLFKDYGAGSLSDASAQLILALQQGGLITKETAIREQQRRGMLSPDLDPDEELESVGTEGPMLGAVMPAPIAEPKDEDGDEAQDEPRVAPAAPVPVVAPAVAPAPLFDYLEFARILAEAIGRIPGAVVNVPEQAAPVVNMPPITVEGSTINVTSPEQQAPVVNVAPASVTVNMPEQQSPVVNVPVVVNTPEVSMPPVNVSPAAVTVNVPEQPASVINVAPPSVSVTVEKGGAVRFIEDASGNLTGAVME